MENNKSFETSEFGELVRRYAHFLREIRKRLILVACVFVVGLAIGFVFYESIIRFAIDSLNLHGVNIVFTTPFQFINLAVSCGIATGILLVFPLLLYQVLSFLKPALKEREFRMIIWFLPFSIGLFIIGFSFGVLIMRWQIHLFLTKSVDLGIGNILDISSLISTVMLVSSIMGLAFQFPIVLLLLLRLGIISHDFLSKQRLWVYLGSLGFVLLLPVDSILADLILALPLAGLFELTLFIDRLFARRKKVEK